MWPSPTSTTSGSTKQHHIVLMMTDGEWDKAWGKDRTLAFYAKDRKFIGFGLDSYQSSADRYAANLKRYGLRESYGITNLNEMLRHLQRMLLTLA